MHSDHNDNDDGRNYVEFHNDHDAGVYVVNIDGTEYVLVRRSDFDDLADAVDLYGLDDDTAYNLCRAAAAIISTTAAADDPVTP